MEVALTFHCEKYLWHYDFPTTSPWPKSTSLCNTQYNSCFWAVPLYPHRIPLLWKKHLQSTQQSGIEYVIVWVIGLCCFYSILKVLLRRSHPKMTICQITLALWFPYSGCSKETIKTHCTKNSFPMPQFVATWDTKHADNSRALQKPPSLQLFKISCTNEELGQTKTPKQTYPEADHCDRANPFEWINHYKYTFFLDQF